jgi:hypothetical protein
MKRFLLITATLLALTSGATAKMPKELTLLSGPDWCQEKVESRGGGTIIHMTERSGCENPSSFAIETDGSFGWEDTSCSPIRVKDVSRGKWWTWMITARCTYYGGPRDYTKTEMFKFELDKNGLVLTTKTK